MREDLPMWKRVLMAMREREGMTAQEIEKASGVDAKTVRPYLSMFRSRGVVARERRAGFVMWFLSVPLTAVTAAPTAYALRPTTRTGEQSDAY
jgi:DNA-binding IclR family transcriptional regulator